MESATGYEIDCLQFAYSRFQPAKPAHPQPDNCFVLDIHRLTLPSGQITSILGPNGSGKTTLIKILARLMRQYQGEVRLNGQLLNNYGVKDFSRKVAYVAQTFSTLFPVTVRDLLSYSRFPRMLNPLRENHSDSEVINIIAERLDISQFFGRDFQQLSGGEQQRILVATALVQEPEVLLLDEPIANLDIAHQIEILELLREINDDHSLTIIYSTHDINLANYYSDTCIILKDGNLHAIGTPTDVLKPSTLAQVYHVDLQEIGVTEQRWLIPRLSSYSPSANTITRGDSDD